MLVGEDGRWSEERDLLTFHDRLECRAHGDLGLAIADVAAEEAIHRRRLFHVPLGIGNRGCLIGGQLVRESILELLLPGAVSTEGVSGDQLSFRVELEQLLGHVAHGPFGAGLGLLPGDAAKPVKRGDVGLRARVLLNKIEPLDRDIELGPLGKDEQHELSLRAGPGLVDLPGQTGIDLGRTLRPAGIELHQSLELPNAVVDVDDIVANLQVPKIGEKGSRR